MAKHFDFSQGSWEFDDHYDRNQSREPRVTLRRVATSPADQLERIALKCSAAFVKADDDHETAARDEAVQS